MIAANVRTRAVIAQEQTHERRAYHREKQKAAERDDQTFKKIIRAYDRITEKKVQADLDGDKEIASILADASDDVLEALGLSPETSPSPAPSVVDVESSPVVEGAAPDPSLPAPDGPAEAGTADADREADDDPGASGSGDAGLVTTQAADGSDRNDGGEGAAPALIVHKHKKIQQPIANMDDPAERVFVVLEAERSGDVSSLEWVELLKRTKLSPARLKYGLEALKASGRVREVRAAERGTKTFLMSVAAEAAE